VTWKNDPNLRGQAETLRAEAQGQIAIKRGDQYHMEKIDWLWPGWIARGKFHVIGGQKGAGKSTIIFNLLAQITSGCGKWPDETPVLLQGDVQIWSGEDDIADTILPRFAVAGGDLSRVYFIDGIIVDGVKRGFDPATDMPALVAAAQQMPNLAAILIDPVVSATPGDSFKNAETRRGLQPLVDLAGERNIAVIGITHFTKGSQGRDPIERITGSLAYGALPRVVWAAAKGDTEDAPRRFVRIASNIGPTGDGFEYLLFQQPVPDRDFTAQHILWGGPLKGSPLELLEPNEEKQKKEAAGDLLDSLLVNGPIAVTKIKEAATANNVSWATVQRAKADAKPVIHAAQAGTLRDLDLLPENSKASGWYWYREQPRRNGYDQ
jgi:putative DNA primase/helicase